ncbi:MAG: aspartate/tyrosine/aromatic aminotransferase [Gammaproteobacteria bacterium]|nr:aspartate/tyrosine/aromatic aminotransferase [Gammaproteobacteria bacterium]
MFQLDLAPADPILGLTETFKADTHPDKINLGVGVYQDATGKTPILKAVTQAETRLLETETSKSYLSIPGVPEVATYTQELLFGAGHAIIQEGRAKTAQTPGGTGALRVAADFLLRAAPKATVWISNPSWANHQAIFEAAGFPVKDYRYYDKASQGLDGEGFMADLEGVSEGDVVILHGCCHNPSGIDLDQTAWEAIAAQAKAKNLICLVDFAYQGFGEGIEEDRAGLHVLLGAGLAVLVASSYSKNFGLYNERIGAITVVEETANDAVNAFSHVQAAIRAIYSSPPAHGGKIVATILGDSALKALWIQELADMRARIKEMRQAFVQGMADRQQAVDFDFINHQKGMFSFSGLTQEQVLKLRADNHIYIVGSGRINVAGITPANIDPLCDAIAKVL